MRQLWLEDIHNDENHDVLIKLRDAVDVMTSNMR
jgi:hypothetical protein